MLILGAVNAVRPEQVLGRPHIRLVGRMHDWLEIPSMSIGAAGPTHTASDFCQLRQRQSMELS